MDCEIISQSFTPCDTGGPTAHPHRGAETRPAHHGWRIPGCPSPPEPGAQRRRGRTAGPAPRCLASHRWRATGGSRCPRDGPRSTSPRCVRRGARRRSRQPRRLSWCSTTATHPRRRPSLRRAHRPRPGGWLARVERHDTPTHGRGRQRAATDRSVLATPGVDRRMPDPTTRPQAVAAWEPRRHQAKCPVDGRVTTRKPASRGSHSTRQCSSVKPSTQ